LQIVFIKSNFGGSYWILDMFQKMQRLLHNSLKGVK